MYNKISGSWVKHWDFMILDTVVIQAAFILAYILRNGFENPYAKELYLNIAVMLFLVGICAGFFLENYSGIMRRGFFQEFKAVLKYVFTICVFIMFYLFLSKNSSEYSRISFIVFTVIAVFMIYLERIFWKMYVRKHRDINDNQTALLILTSADIAEQVITTVKKNSYNETRIGQGRENTKQFLREHPDICLEIENKVREHYGLPLNNEEAASVTMVEPQIKIEETEV